MFDVVNQVLPWAVVDAYKERIMKLGADRFDPVELMEAAAKSRGWPLPDPLEAVIRLDEHYAPKESPPSPPKRGPSLGSDFNAWCQTQSVKELILLCCGHRYLEARQLYETVDFKEVIDFLDHYLIAFAKHKKYEMEVVMYGMGGHYKGDALSEGDTNVHHLNSADSKQREAARARLKALGMA